ncbi:hypothetical protein MNBD_GAMMA18-1898 [hydrothermal vent metagenome]|uniref:Uncharacterized protein n=1 Tax=hydrothermal vent metagenome TaxID=652676 RepID=A0A3B0Z5R5_9ZZZZ
MKMSPEFLRHLWLEMTLHRRLMMPTVLLFIFFIAHALGEWSAVHVTALLSFVVLGLLWGVRLAGESLIGEIDNRTWDQQRMSAITPWQMSWGKLFGSTVYIWYGLLIVVVVFLLSGLRIGEPMLWAKLLLLLSGAVLVQALALLMSLLMVRRSGRHRRSLSNLALIATLLFIMAVAPYYDEYYAQFSWYGLVISELTFFALSSLLFCGWALLGLYRTMGEELQLKHRPLLWLGFSLFLIFYIMGFSPLESGDGWQLNLAGAFFIALLLCYVMIFIERKEPLDLRRFQITRAEQGAYAALIYLPCWLVSLLLVVVLGLLLLLVDGPKMNILEIVLPFNQLVLLSLLFLIRDIAIVIYFNLTRQPQRADATALIYLTLLYLLLPMLFSVIGLGSLNNLLMPAVTTSPLVTLLSGGVQCAVLGWLIYQRWLSGYRH